ncbi:type II secretion system protein [Vibrio navarrensis]|nr:type II secretion system protein [Vibrio navarrensis]EJL6566615.1 type II secretion system protein [Vibrio navarrensis]
MKRQGGFTLIELVVVIVILGILAVTAAPRFLNLQGDARKASAQGLKGAIEGAAGIVYGKAAIAGVEASSSASVTINGTSVALVYGYPAATSTALQSVVTGLDKDWKLVSGATGVGYGFTANNTDCYVNYSAATSTASPTVSLENCN